MRVLMDIAVVRSPARQIRIGFCQPKLYSLARTLIPSWKPVAEYPDANCDQAYRYRCRNESDSPSTITPRCTDERHEFRTQPNERKPKQPRTNSLNTGWIA
jgi:hypothetical protein